MEWALELAVVVGCGARLYCLGAASAGDLLGGCRMVVSSGMAVAARERRSAVAWQQQGTAALEAAVDEGVFNQ